LSVSDFDLISSTIQRAVESTSTSRDPAGGKFYVGYSGGLDSSVLLHAAHQLYPERLIALHVNHGLQVAADHWQSHCARVCSDWQIEFRSRAVEVAGGNLEAASRVARYAYFTDQLSVGDLLLLAHHQDDQAETVLLRLAQGRGLIGMPGQRPVGQGTLLRPLLSLPRSVLESYARRWRLRWVEDPSNTDTALDRNYLRAQVMPALRARWPGIGEAFEEILSQRRSIDEKLLADLAPLSAALAIDRLRCESEAATVELLRVWLLARHAVAPSSRALRSFVAQLDAPADRQPALTLNTGSLRRYRQSIYHVPDRPLLEASYPLVPPVTLLLPHGKLQVSASAGTGFTLTGDARVVFPDQQLTAERRLLLRGHRRDLKKLLQQADVPPWERSCYPLLEDAGGIVAVPGVGYRDCAPPEDGGRLWQVAWFPHVH
jgi:tRNA(Ile)-lysidine synthase